MNLFYLKLIATLTMILDHLSYFLFSWNLISSNLNLIFRAVGRLSFPIYAFCIVNGFQRTNNKEKYLFKLIIFSCISQIPYSLTFDTTNTMILNYSLSDKFFILSPLYFQPIWLIHFVGNSLFLFVLFKFIYKNYLFKTLKHSLIMFIYIFLQIFLLKINYIYIISEKLNIFYTLSLGLFSIISVDNIRSHNLPKSFYLLFFLPVFFICIFCDIEYGILGVLLIVVLYLLKESKIYQALSIIIWAIVFYFFIFPQNFLFVFVSCFLILLYNNKKGLNVKYAFYLVYPLHLLVLGILNVIFRLDFIPK